MDEPRARGCRDFSDFSGSAPAEWSAAAAQESYAMHCVSAEKVNLAHGFRACRPTFSHASRILLEHFGVAVRITALEESIMKTITSLAALAAALVVAAPASAQTSTRYNSSSSYQDEEARFDAAQRRFDNEYEQYQAAVDRYRRSRASRPIYDDRGPDRYEDDENYEPSRYYRSGNYQERVLTRDERVYRGEDGRYYCKRSDGTTGLIVGAAAGGLFGNIIAGRRSSTVGTLLGAIAGGAAGASIDRNQQQVRCR
jgi:uncharacterized protein YozE (UPF0346 family)